MQTRWINGVSLASLLLGAACADVDSKSIDTDGIVATYSAVFDGSQARAEANLAVGGRLGTQVRLSHGDELTVTFDGQTQDLYTSELLTFINYYSSWRRGRLDEGTRFTFALTRDVKVSAPDSTVRLPAPFSILSEPPDSPAAPGQQFVLTLDGGAASGETQTYRINGTCIGLRTQNFSGDSVRVTIPSATGRTERDCDVTVVVERSRRGTVDSALDPDSSATAVQRRELETFTVHVPGQQAAQ